MKNITLNSQDTDRLTELVNMGMGRAAASLSEITGRRIELRVPEIHMLDNDEIPAMANKYFTEELTCISQMFQGNFKGIANLLFPDSSAMRLSSFLMDDEIPKVTLDSEQAGVLMEVGNILLNGLVGTFSNTLQIRLNYSVPEIEQTSLARFFSRPTFAEGCKEYCSLLAEAHFKISSMAVNGIVLIIFEIESLETLLDAVTRLE